MNESEANPNKADETSEPSADDGSRGDFTLEELMRSHGRNFDHLGRRIDRPEGDK